MHVFVTGGTGQTGPAIVTELLAAGHAVTGLARSEAGAARLRALGATPLRGSLEDLDRVQEAAAAAEGVVHMAYGGDFHDVPSMIRREAAALEAFGRALAGSGKPLVVTSGTLVLPAGREATEQDAPDDAGIAAFRLVGERAALDLAARGVRASVLRLAPTVHGPQDHGFIPMLIATARTTGVSAYVGDGSNRWPAVHRLDAASAFRLALEDAPAGSVLHAVAENVPFRSIAEHVADGLGIGTVSLSPEEAVSHFANPFMAALYGRDVPVSSASTQDLLGWRPSHATLLEDLTEGDYFAVPDAQPVTDTV